MGKAFLECSGIKSKRCLAVRLWSIMCQMKELELVWEPLKSFKQEHDLIGFELRKDHAARMTENNRMQEDQFGKWTVAEGNR